MKKVLSLAVVLLAGGILLASMVTAQFSPRAVNNFTATLANGGSGDAGGTGSATVTISDVTSEICYTVDFVLTDSEALTLGHIHTHSDDSVVVTFAEAVGATASFSGCVTDAVQAAAIIANPGGYYVNLHDTSFPNGAIQGDLVAGAVETETPTNIPVETETPTDVPVETATPTDVPVSGTELVADGGFENELIGWDLKNSAGDKVKCDTETKTFAYEGSCAFKFKGSVGENSKLQQILSLTPATRAEGDTLDLSAFIDAKKDTAAGKIKLVVKYADETSAKAIAAFVQTDGYQEITGDQIVLGASDVSKIKLQIKHNSANGKVYVDAVSVRLNGGSVVDTPTPVDTLVGTATDVPVETETATDVPVETATATETPLGLIPLP